MTLVLVMIFMLIVVMFMIFVVVVLMILVMILVVMLSVLFVLFVLFVTVMAFPVLVVLAAGVSHFDVAFRASHEFVHHLPHFTHLGSDFIHFALHVRAASIGLRFAMFEYVSIAATIWDDHNPSFFVLTFLAELVLQSFGMVVKAGGHQVFDRHTNVPLTIVLMFVTLATMQLFHFATFGELQVSGLSLGLHFGLQGTQSRQPGANFLLPFSTVRFGQLVMQTF